MKINKVTFSKNKIKQSSIKTKDYAAQQINLGTTKMSQKSKVVTGILSALGLIAATVVGVKKGVFSKILHSSDFKPYDITKFKNIDFNEKFKKEFTDSFVSFMKKPITDHFGNRIYPRNGYIVYGSNSKAQADKFNWMLGELKKAGAEIIDPGNGKKANFEEVDNKWWELWKNYSKEEFEKTGKYKVFVVRGLDEIGQPKNCKKHFQFPDGCILKDSPDSHASCRKRGIMLFYDCVDPSKLDPAVIRVGRVDIHEFVEPYADESIGIWTDYLKQVKSHEPSVAVRRFETAKAKLLSRGDDAYEQLKPLFKYSVPYYPPRFDEPLETWKKYVQKTNENENFGLININLRNTLRSIRDQAKNPKYMEKYNAIRKMTDDVQKPENLKGWRFAIDQDIKGMGIDYQ